MADRVYRNAFYCVITVLSCFWWLVPYSSASNFEMRSDGSIIVGQQTFSDMGEYVRSEYFRENNMRCGTKTPIIGFDEPAQRDQADCTLTITRIQNEYWPNHIYEIPVWWHVIYQSSGVGNITNAAITAQMMVLNEDFRAMAGTMGSNGYDTMIQFKLAGITRTINNGWFTDSEVDQSAYKQALNVNPDQFLNVYTNDARGYLGYAYYPQSSAGSWIDGIVLNYSTVGGRNNTTLWAYNQGRTLVHEMGHYLGLYHTFHNETCTNTYSGGDLIVDTNAEIIDHYGCSQTYTCGTSDPIHNYMNYTDDVCMYQFTREQANRAVCSLVNYRPNVYSIIQLYPVIVPQLSPLLLD